jgi:hypothetical protein
MADMPPPPPGFIPVESQAAPAMPPPPPGFVPMETTAPAPVAGPGTDDGFRPPPLQMAPPGAGEGGLTINIAKKEPPTLVDRIMSGAKDVYDTTTAYGTQVAAGANKGIANMVGLPGDLAAAVTGTHPTFGGEQVYNALFPQAPPPDSGGQRIARRVGEEVGAMAVPVIGAGAKAAQVGVQGARELGPVARAFVEPMAVAPGRTVAKETAAALTGGGGAGVVGEYSGKNKAEVAGQKPTTGQQAADLGGALGGYTLGAIGGKVADVTRHVVGAIRGRGKLATEVARDAATDEIARAAGLEPSYRGAINTDPLVAAINGADTSARETIPGLRPSLADTTGNEGLAALEYSRQSGPNSGAYTASSATDNAVAIDSAMDQLGAERPRLARSRTRWRSSATPASAQQASRRARLRMRLRPLSSRSRRTPTPPAPAAATRFGARSTLRATPRARPHATPTRPPTSTPCLCSLLSWPRRWTALRQA